MSRGINLIVTKNKTIFTPLLKRITLLRVIAVGLLFIVSVAATILFIIIAISPLPALQKQEQNFRVSLSQANTDIVRFLILRERIGSISQVVSKRTDYYRMIDSLRSKIPSSSSITALELGKKNVSIRVADPTLSNIDTLVNAVMSDTGINKTFSYAKLSSLSWDPLQDAYLLHLELTIP